MREQRQAKDVVKFLIEGEPESAADLSIAEVFEAYESHSTLHRAAAAAPESRVPVVTADSRSK